jgi:Baseplate J-like protein
MSTSVPQIQFTPSGLIIPTEAAILAGTQADFNAAFGGGLNPQLTAPQGQLASSQAAIVADKDSQIAYVTNQFDPQYAEGRFQDALARIYFLTRKPAQSTAVTCTLSGLPGTVIPAGSLAYDTNGNTYSLLGTVTIGSGSTVSSSWQNIETGPIACPANTLTRVGQSISGWDTITNPSQGTLGNVVESRADFYNRVFNSVAINGEGTCPAIYAAAFEVSNVLDVFVVDNPANSIVSSDPLPGGTRNSTNYPLAPHSIYVAVVGGDDQEIANNIWDKKDVGADYSAHPIGESPVPGQGTVSDNTVVDTSGYNFPFPTYQVSFIRPGPLPIFFAVSIANTPNLPSDITTLIQNAIVAQFNGQNGNARARIGSAVLAAQYYAAVAAIGSYLVLLSITVGTSASPTDDEVQVGIDQTPTISAGNISVTLV